MILAHMEKNSNDPKKNPSNPTENQKDPMKNPSNPTKNPKDPMENLLELAVMWNCGKGIDDVFENNQV